MREELKNGGLRRGIERRGGAGLRRPALRPSHPRSALEPPASRSGGEPGASARRRAGKVVARSGVAGGVAARKESFEAGGRAEWWRWTPRVAARAAGAAW